MTSIYKLEKQFHDIEKEINKHLRTKVKTTTYKLEGSDELNGEELYELGLQKGLTIHVDDEDNFYTEVLFIESGNKSDLITVFSPSKNIVYKDSVINISNIREKISLIKFLNTIE